MLSMKVSNLFERHLIYSFTKRVLLLIITLAFLNCSENRFESKEELLTFIKDENNNYVQQKSVNGFVFKLQYRPTDLLVLQELSNTEFTLEKVNQLRNKYDKQIYFNLSISKNNKELLSATPKNRNEFNTMVNQLTFGMGENVHLFTNQKDTLKLIDFVYPRMYGMSRSTTIMFVYSFEEEKLKQEYLNFTINDLVISTGEVKFKIETDKIKNEPSLSF